jgi:phosphoribosylaminoimidazole carboxylase (NCAIR synthetase)
VVDGGYQDSTFGMAVVEHVRKHKNRTHPANPAKQTVKQRKQNRVYEREWLHAAGFPQSTFFYTIKHKNLNVKSQIMFGLYV